MTDDKRQRCGKSKRHVPHWHDKKWCDGKIINVQEDSND